MSDKLNNFSPAASGRDEKRKRRAVLLKFTAMLALTAVVIIFGSMHMITKQMTTETA